MDMGAGLPGQSASIPRISNKGYYRRGKTSGTASCRQSLKFEDASADMRQLFGSPGGASRQGTLSTGEATEPRAGGEERKAKQASGKKKEDGPPQTWWG